ncbi:MAG: FAD:protein FMN transferase [Defluviitaleaceae bacterium]|nr:FAD:protein FMN transferase [Defluviitaleaceae bacterium]
MKSKFTLTAICLVMLLTGCNFFSPLRLYETSFLLLFNTKITIMHYTYSAEDFRAFAELAHNKFENYHRLFNIHTSYDGVNNIKTVNSNAGISEIIVDDAIIDLLVFAKEKYEIASGTVNIALGPVLTIWRSYREAGLRDPESARIPSVEQLQAAHEYSSICNVLIDEERRTVFLPYENMSLDVGSVAKGFAVQRVAEGLKAEGYDSFLINAGGDVKAVGTKIRNTPWNIGVANPNLSGELIATLQIADMSTATSGDYQQYFTVNNQRHNHIIDPGTLFPALNFRSVTVINENAGIADFLSTALFVMSYEDGKKLIENFENTYAIWVDAQFNVQFSERIDHILRY